MDYPPRRPFWRYLWWFLVAAFGFICLFLLNLPGIATALYPGLVSWWDRKQPNWWPDTISMGIFPLIALVGGILWAAIWTMLLLRKERDAYHEIVESHYGIKAALHRLKTLQRAGKKLWDEAPQHWSQSHFSENLKIIQSWDAECNEWRGKVEHALSELFSDKDRARFLFIDESAVVDEHINKIEEMRVLLGKFQQYLDNIDQIIKEHEV